MKTVDCDYLVVGSGMAGPMSALHLVAYGKVAVVTKARLQDCNSNFAQGGICCVADPKDTFDGHARDTMIAGAWLGKSAVVHEICENAPAGIQDLIDCGVRFAKKEDGSWDLTREGGHSARRIFHAGDITGEKCEAAMIRRVKREKEIEVREQTIVIDLVMSSRIGLKGEKRCVGAYAMDKPTCEFPSEALATLVADGSCAYLDATGTVGQTYFYWVEAVGAADRTESKDAASGMKEKAIVHSAVTYTNLKGAANPNSATYEEGKVLAFAAPGTVTGYTFTGWTPAQITAEMTGAQTVRANWRANAYQIVYGANGGTGATGPTDCEYDAEGVIAANGFVRAGYVFRGWATKEGGEVVYAPGTKVKNLTSNAGGVVRLYAVWEAENVENPVIIPADGTVFKTKTCMVTISCATEDVDIYCSTNGRTPRPTESNRYKGPFAVSGTTTVLAYAVKGEKESELVEATLTYVEPEPLTLETALDEKKLAQITMGGERRCRPRAVWRIRAEERREPEPRAS